MKIFVWKKDNESNERLIARFNKRVQGSRKLLKIKSERYHVKPPKKRLERISAIIREKYRAAKEKNKFY